MCRRHHQNYSSYGYDMYSRGGRVSRYDRDYDYDYDYDYCTHCGRNPYDCRCRGRRGYDRRPRGPGPVGLLITGVIGAVKMVQEHQAKKKETKRLEGEKFVESLREEDRQHQQQKLATQQPQQHPQEDEESSSSYQEVDEVAAREYEQHIQNLRDQQQNEQPPPSYQSVIQGK